ncbi:MAG: GNAT family N-acetyltransferase [Acidimicrobiales bacterium]
MVDVETPSGWQLAQINIATLVADADDPAVAPFMQGLDHVNAVADATPGLVWRLQTDEGNATSIHVFDDPRRIVNLTVWTSVDALREFTYRSDHVGFLRRRGEWFVPGESRAALWWIPEGDLPTVDDGVRRTAFLDRHGPSPHAFGFTTARRPLLIENTQLDDPDTQVLVERLNAELTELADNPCENHFGLTVDETSGDNGAMVRARYDGVLVGCGAVRRIGPDVGEIKRMFVDESVRGLKIGAALLDRLEAHALARGMRELKLETSDRQPAAVGLYERVGFGRCEPWGEYLATAATSVCYSKRF